VPLSGKAMLRLYRRAGWIVLHSRGSHVKVGKGNLREIIPLHKELAFGLEQKLLKRLARP
jgi:predicted RNA binding protein YcfA (HicA-like mRNA interferase family)